MLVVDYWGRHWRGELSLPVAFWFNFVGLNLLLLLIRPWVEQSLIALSIDDDPRLMAQLALLHLAFVYALIYPWQVVGVWRSARCWYWVHRRRFWALASQATVVLALLVTVITGIMSGSVYRDIVMIAAGPDRYAGYQLTSVAEGELLYFEGPIGYRAARDLRRMLQHMPEVRGVILDSQGGWIAGGRGLAAVIREFNLATYSFNGCHSACVTAFIAGYPRFLADEARLGFHQYAVPFQGLRPYSDMSVEQQRDLQTFYQQGVHPAFLARLFQAEHGDAWYPSQRELLAHRVITGVVRSEEILLLGPGLTPGQQDVDAVSTWIECLTDCI